MNRKLLEYNRVKHNNLSHPNYCDGCGWYFPCDAAEMVMAYDELLSVINSDLVNGWDNG